MRIIQNHGIVKGDNGGYILINALYGLIDRIDEVEYALFEKWRVSEEIKYNNLEEKEFYEQLYERKYVIESHEEEDRIKEDILERLRQKYQRLKNNSSSIGLVVTYNCNFSCPYCFENEIKEKSLILSFEQVDKIKELHPNPKKILLYGGEPLLPETKEIIQYIIHVFPDANYSILTNGYCLDQFLPIVSNLDLDFIQITLDGNEVNHNKTRRLKGSKEPTYEKIFNNIALTLENGIPIRIRMNVSQKSVDECLILRSFLENKFEKQRNLLSFEIQPIFQLSINEKVKIEPKIFNGNDKSKNNINFTQDNRMNALYTLSPIKHLYYNCPAEINAKLYDPYGYIYSCILAVGQEKAAVGKYIPEVKYFNSSLYERNIETIPECKNCGLALVCGGGCGYGAMRQNGTCLSPECSNLRKTLIYYI